MISKSSVVDFGSLTPKVIIQLDTPIGYMQVLEYVLQDCSCLHVVMWHFCDILDEERLPKVNSKVFYKNKNLAIAQAYEVGTELLKCF